MSEEGTGEQWQGTPGLGIGQVVLWLLLTGVGALLYYLPDLLAAWFPG